MPAQPTGSRRLPGCQRRAQPGTTAPQAPLPPPPRRRRRRYHGAPPTASPGATPASEAIGALELSKNKYPSPSPVAAGRARRLPNRHTTGTQGSAKDAHRRVECDRPLSRQVRIDLTARCAFDRSRHASVTSSSCKGQTMTGFCGGLCTEGLHIMEETNCNFDKLADCKQFLQVSYQKQMPLTVIASCLAF